MAVSSEPPCVSMRIDAKIVANRVLAWRASVPDLPGCIAVGANRQEAESLIREAIEAHLEALRECGIAVPEPLHEIGEVEVTAA